MTAGVGLSGNLKYTLVSSSYTTAVAQMLQLPSIPGKDINMMLFEFSKNQAKGVQNIVDSYAMVRASGFDTCILASSDRGLEWKAEIHIWIMPSDFTNANLMILLGFVIMEHPQWKKEEIEILAVVHDEEREQ